MVLGMEETVRDTARHWISLNEAAEYLGVQPLTVRRMVARGDLTAYRLGSRLLRFDRAELDAAMRPVPTAGGAA